MKAIVSAILVLFILCPVPAFASEPVSSDDWRVVVIDGVSYIQFSEQAAVSILARLEQNEIRRVELAKALENQRNLQLALHSSQKETRKWQIITVVASGVALGFLGVAVLK